MAAPKRSTIYFDPKEDAADLDAFEKRRRQPAVDFEEVVLRLRRSGKLSNVPVERRALSPPSNQ